MDIAFSTIELKDDTIIVVLGASGDLAKKKTVRAPPSWIPMTPTNNLAVPRTIRSRMCATYELSQLQSTDHVLQFRNKFLPKDIQIVGYARTKMDHDEYLKRVRSYIKVPTKEIEEQLDQFCNMCTYVSESQDQNVLNHLLTEVVVDTEDLLLLPVGVQSLLQVARALKVLTERLLDLLQTILINTGIRGSQNNDSQ